MELLILSCLLIIIFLLTEDKLWTRKKRMNKEITDKGVVRLPDIMGQPKTGSSHSLPNTHNESHNDERKDKADNFDIEIDKENNSIQIPEEELDNVFGNGPDLQEEEEEWNTYGISGSDSGFATGVTFEELSTVGMLLQQKVLEPSQHNKAVGIVQKIQGTELFSLLENSMEGVSQKIAGLLDRSLSEELDSGSSFKGSNNLEDFDIGEFV